MKFFCSILQKTLSIATEMEAVEPLTQEAICSVCNGSECTCPASAESDNSNLSLKRPRLVKDAGLNGWSLFLQERSLSIPKGREVWHTLTSEEKDAYTQSAAQINAEKGYVELTPEQCQKKVQTCLRTIHSAIDTIRELNDGTQVLFVALRPSNRQVLSDTIPANAMEMLDEAFMDPKLGSFLHQLESVLLAGVMRTKTRRRMHEGESLEEEKNYSREIWRAKARLNLTECWKAFGKKGYFPYSETQVVRNGKEFLIEKRSCLAMAMTAMLHGSMQKMFRALSQALIFLL